MAEGGNPPPSESAWTKWKSYLRKSADEYKTKRAIERAQRPPSGWSKSEYPKHLDSLDPFYSKFQGKPIGEAKLVSRPRTPEERAAAKPDVGGKKVQMLKLNLTEAVDKMTKITDEIISILDECLMTETLDKFTILEKLAEALNLTDEIDFVYQETRCGVPSQYQIFNGKLKEDLEKARSTRFMKIKEQLLKCYDNLNCLRQLHKRTKENARTLERRYKENRQIKQKLRRPRPPNPMDMKITPYVPPVCRSKRKGPNRGERRRARAIKPKSPLSIEDPSKATEEEECLSSESVRSSITEEDVGAIASASASASATATAKQTAMQKAATSARRREALQPGSNDGFTSFPDIGKLSIMSPDPTEEDRLSPQSTRSSITEDLGAIASASSSAKAKQNAMQKVATSAAASIAKFARRREALQPTSNDGFASFPDIEKLSLLSPDETDDDIDDLYRDSDDDTADDEASDYD